MIVRHDLPKPPRAIARLPVDERGYPVPWFVAYFGGKPDFRVTDPRKFAIACQASRCWICGGSLRERKAFVFGPMSAIQAISGEPPNHPACATYAVQVCPFLVLPRAKRRLANLPNATEVATTALMIAANPGISALWITRRRSRVTVNADGSPLIVVGEPEAVQWYTHGRRATPTETRASLASAYADLCARKLFEPTRLARGYARALRFTSAHDGAEKQEE